MCAVYDEETKDLKQLEANTMGKYLPELRIRVLERMF